MYGLEKRLKLFYKADITGATFGSCSRSLNISQCLDSRTQAGRRDDINTS